MLQESVPLHTTIQPNNIKLQDDNFLQPLLSTPTVESSQFQQVPIFEYDNIDNTELDEKSVEHTVTIHNKFKSRNITTFRL